MSKKKKKSPETTIEDYYDLKVDKVDELVAALKDGESAGNVPITTDISEITGEEVKGRSEKARNFDPYRRDKLAAIPTWLKAIFIKWWFLGLICFLVNMGLGLYIANDLDLLVVTGVIAGIITDVFVNPIFRFFESDRHEYNAYMMFPFPFKAFWTFFTNIIYYVAVMMLVGFSYTGINYVLRLINENWYLYTEPLLFGIISVAIDMAFIGVKDLIVYLVKKFLRKGKMEAEENV